MVTMRSSRARTNSGKAVSDLIGRAPFWRYTPPRMPKIERFMPQTGGGFVGKGLGNKAPGNQWAHTRLACEGSDPDGVLAPQPTADAGRDRVGRGGAFLGCGGESGQIAAATHDAAIRSCRARQVL